MADPQSSVTATVNYDVSPLEQGAAKSVAALKSMADQSSTTSDVMKTKFQAMEQAAKEAAGRITEADLSIARSAIEVRNAQNDRAKALKDATSQTYAGADATVLLADRLRNERILALETGAAVKGLAAAHNQLATSAHASVTEVQAVSGGVRLLDGNPGIRAVERFITTIPGMGTAFRAIFPIIGAVGLTGLLFDMGEKAFEAGQKAKNAARDAQPEYETFSRTLSTTNDELELQNAKLADEISKISGKPRNGIQVALEEGVVSADRLLVSLGRDVDEFDKLMQQHSVSEFDAMLSSLLPGGGGVSTGASQDAIEQIATGFKAQLATAKDAHDQALLAAKAAHDRQIAVAGSNHAAVIAADQRFYAAKRAVEDEYYRKSAAAAAESAAAARKQATDIATQQSIVDHGGGPKLDLSNQRTQYENAAVVYDRVGRSAQLSGTNVDEEAAKAQAQAKKDADEAAKRGAQETKRSIEEEQKANEQRLRDMEAFIDQWDLLGNVTSKALYDYWEEQKSTFAVGSAQFDQIVHKQAELAISGARKFHEGIVKLKEQQERDAKEATEINLSMQSPNATGMGKEAWNDMLQSGPKWDEYWRNVARGHEVQAKINADLAEAGIRAREAAGELSPLGAAQQTAALHTAQFRAELEALEAELARLQRDATKDLSGKVTNPKQAAQIVQVQTQITQLKGQGQLQGGIDQKAQAAAMAAPYKEAWKTVSTSFDSVVDQILRGQKSIAQGARMMAADMTMAVIHGLEQQVEKHGAAEVMKLAQRHVANAQKAASDQITAANSAASAATANVAAATSAAGLAGANAVAATAIIPFVGPELAPAAGAEAFSAASGFGSMAAFAKGGIVIAGTPGGAVPILAHDGERVLSQSQTNNFERLVNNSATSGDTVLNFNGNHTYGGGEGGSWKSGLREHRLELAKTIKALHREGHLG